jgi:methylenetetrahydrofolate dehydrogenase (NADP+)/methenyltetrahydrofolate cyclohydrolase
LGLLSDICSDSTVDAVIVETPYPKHLSFQDIADALPADKDAEGITPECYGLLFQAKTWSQVKNLIVPSTALAVAHLAQSLGPVAGQQAVVIGRSDTVGRPSAHLLSSLDMTVTLAHSRTKNLAALCRHADVLVAAAGVAGLVNADWIKPGALVIDVGFHSSRKGTVGDVAARADQFAKAITCVPGGVGPVATAITLLQTSVSARDNGNRVAARKSP